MTGREIILYILENKLEDRELFTDKLMPLFVTADHAAVKWNCGTAIVKAMIEMKKVKGVKIGDNYFVIAMEENPFEKRED